MLYIWAKENPDYKYQQGMNDILATVLVSLLSDVLLRELPTHFEPDFDYEAHLRCFKDEEEATGLHGQHAFPNLNDT